MSIQLNYFRTSIQQNEAVWFGCEIGKRNVAKQGYLDLEVITSHFFIL